MGKATIESHSKDTMSFSMAVIIYNPLSTGSGKAMAEQLQKELAKVAPKLTVSLEQTKYAGHGTELAYQLATRSKRPLIISASGDGGYHDVVNGLMKARSEGHKPVGGLLPAGNANDHFMSMHHESLSKAIVSEDVQTIDLLKLATTVDGKPYEAYAHSYIGIGLSPQVGQRLNKTKLNLINQVWITIQVLLFLRPVKIKVAKREHTYDSLVFSNVGRMAKVLSLAKDASPTDGKFEVTEFHRRSKISLIKFLLKASTTGLEGGRKATKFSFETINPTELQLDGEIIAVDSMCKVDISIKGKVYECVI